MKSFINNDIKDMLSLYYKLAMYTLTGTPFYSGMNMNTTADFGMKTATKEIPAPSIHRWPTYIHKIYQYESMTCSHFRHGCKYMNLGSYMSYRQGH